MGVRSFRVVAFAFGLVLMVGALSVVAAQPLEERLVARARNVSVTPSSSLCVALAGFGRSASDDGSEVRGVVGFQSRARLEEVQAELGRAAVAVGLQQGTDWRKNLSNPLYFTYYGSGFGGGSTRYRAYLFVGWGGRDGVDGCVFAEYQRTDAEVAAWREARIAERLLDEVYLQDLVPEPVDSYRFIDAVRLDVDMVVLIFRGATSVAFTVRLTPDGTSLDIGDGPVPPGSPFTVTDPLGVRYVYVGREEVRAFTLGRDTTARTIMRFDTETNAAERERWTAFPHGDGRRVLIAWERGRYASDRVRLLTLLDVDSGARRGQLVLERELSTPRSIHELPEGVLLCNVGVAPEDHWRGTDLLGFQLVRERAHAGYLWDLERNVLERVDAGDERGAPCFEPLLAWEPLTDEVIARRATNGWHPTLPLVARGGLVFAVQEVGAPRDEFIEELLLPRSAGNGVNREHTHFLRGDRLVTLAFDHLRLWRY